MIFLCGRLLQQKQQQPFYHGLNLEVKHFPRLRYLTQTYDHPLLSEYKQVLVYCLQTHQQAPLF